MIRKTMLMVSLLMSVISFSQDTLSKKTNTSGAQAQIKISVLNEQSQPLEGVTVELLKKADSTMVKTAVTDKSGIAELNTKLEGSFIIKASFVNHALVYTAPFDVSGGSALNLPSITLSPASASLQNVTVTAKKPFIQKLTDRIVVNVESSILSAGSTALDILERSPGITVDQNDAVSLRGRAGVIVMIDGKPTPMSGADLANYLRGLPSNAIESIHIITNPSSKYDAAGTSGIIDIRLKKDQRLGLNGTLTAGYGRGVYPKANTGFTFNYRSKKINLFGNYNYSYRYNFNHLLIHWDFFQNGATTGGFDQDFYSRSPSHVHAPRIGVDYNLSRKTIIGAVVSGGFSHVNRTNDNQNIVLNANMRPEFMTKTITNADGDNKNSLFNLNLKHTFDSTGRELSADADYGIFNSGLISDFTTQYLSMNGDKISPNYMLLSNQATDLTIKSAKTDYVHPLKGGARIEAGLKTSVVSADNDLKFYEQVNNAMVTDNKRTNRFIYKESNHAAYLNFRKEFKKVNFQVGIRAEQTDLEGNQVVGNKRFDSSYLQFFPSSFFNYKLKEDVTLGVSVSRRIFRPGYSSLNPFVSFTDPSLYNTGNPALKPEFTWLYELSYTHKNISVTAGYGFTKNIITGLVQQTDTNSRVNFEMPQNLNSLKQYDLVISAPFKPAKWWNMQNTFNVFYAKYDGNVMNTVIDNGRVTFTANVNNSFAFKKGWAAELNGLFRSPRQASLMLIKTQWAVGAGVQKTVMKGKGTVRFNISDIFWTALPNAVTNWATSRETWHAYRESRVGTLNFTYRFGNNKVQAARRRTTASEEERSRAGQ